MSYNDDELVEERGFRLSDGEEEEMEPLDMPEGGMAEDFGLDEESPEHDS